MTRQMESDRHQTEIEAMKADGTYDLYTLQYHFAEALVQQMKRLGMTQAELARKAGVSAPYISRVLLGECNFTFETLVKFARALDCRVEVSLEPVSPAAVRAARTVKKPALPVSKRKKPAASEEPKQLRRRTPQRGG